MKMSLIGKNILLSSLFLTAFSCNNSAVEDDTLDPKTGQIQNGGSKELSAHSDSESSTNKDLKGQLELQIPDGFDLFKKIQGDLNGDKIDDYVLIVKATKKENIVINRFDEKVDRNRRGILVFLSNNNNFNLTTKNLDCFSSESEDGGVYFPPELVVEVEKGKLFIHYAHGRYGFWRYTFRYQQEVLKLIGYDQSDNHGPVVHYFYSYNFLTGNKLTKENINFYSENPEEEVFKETWEELPKSELKSLDAIKDFDQLSFN